MGVQIVLIYHLVKGKVDKALHELRVSVQQRRALPGEHRLIIRLGAVRNLHNNSSFLVRPGAAAGALVRLYSTPWSLLHVKPFF